MTFCSFVRADIAPAVCNGTSIVVIHAVAIPHAYAQKGFEYYLLDTARRGYIARMIKQGPKRALFIQSFLSQTPKTQTAYKTMGRTAANGV